MNKIKMRTFLENIYNCPFVLLVVFTSLIFVLLFDGTGNRKYDREISVSRPLSVGKEMAEGVESMTEEDGKASKEKLETENTAGEKLTKKTGEGDESLQNAGARKEETGKIESKAEQKTDTTNLNMQKKSEESETHATEFVEYTPIETDSRYYSDAGKVALTTSYDYVLENESYFNDAAFLGDSRTLGISDYAGLEGADFFCDSGMTIFKLLGDKGVTYQKTGEKVDMKEILQEKYYGKIYIMLGMNELGYGNTSMYRKQYLEVVRQIREWQPDAIIYVMANLHVSRKKNNMETEFNNININDKNVACAGLANGKDIFYLDCNPLFTDGEGYLQEDITFDGVHLYAQYYDKWREFLLEHGVERKEQDASE